MNQSGLNDICSEDFFFCRGVQQQKDSETAVLVMNKRKQIMHIQHFCQNTESLHSVLDQIQPGSVFRSHNWCSFFLFLVQGWPLFVCLQAYKWSFEFKSLITCKLAATAGATPGPRCFCQAHFELNRAFVQTFIPLTTAFSCHLKLQLELAETGIQ